jgi:hypothetical protein
MKLNLSDYSLINSKQIDDKIKELTEEKIALKDTTHVQHLESLQINIDALNWVKQLLTPSKKLADVAYDAGITHKESSLMFDYPKSRFLNSLIEI